MSTIGDVERKAGIGSSDAERTAFWQQFAYLEGNACLDAGVAELKQMIAERDGAPHHVKQTRQRLPTLSTDQEAALLAYAARRGRRWKSILNNVWMGGAPHDDGGILRGLRNTHGPTWLQSYRLPKVVPRSRPDGKPTVSSEQTGKVEE